MAQYIHSYYIKDVEVQLNTVLYSLYSHLYERNSMRKLRIALLSTLIPWYMHRVFRAPLLPLAAVAGMMRDEDLDLDTVNDYHNVGEDIPAAKDHLRRLHGMKYEAILASQIKSRYASHRDKGPDLFARWERLTINPKWTSKIRAFPNPSHLELAANKLQRDVKKVIDDDFRDLKAFVDSAEKRSEKKAEYRKRRKLWS